MRDKGPSILRTMQVMIYVCYEICYKHTTWTSGSRGTLLARRNEAGPTNAPYFASFKAV